MIECAVPLTPSSSHTGSACFPPFYPDGRYCTSVSGHLPPLFSQLHGVQCVDTSLFIQLSSVVVVSNLSEPQLHTKNGILGSHMADRKVMCFQWGYSIFDTLPLERYLMS